MSIRSAFLLLFVVSTVHSYCIQCATKRLENDWAMTGLPVQPKDMLYDDLCATEPTKLVMKNKPTCSKACVTIFIPVDSAYETVRGCFESFTDPSDSSQSVTAPTTGVNCSFYVDPTATVAPAPGSADSTAKPAMSLVSYNADPLPTVPSNTLFTWTHFDEGKDSIKGLGCVEAPTVKCIECASFDGKGKCNQKEKNTCNGASCIKVSGKLNGRDFVERGCTYVSPYTSNVCFSSSFTSPFFVGMPTGQKVSRSKRDIDMSYKATQCYCTGDSCNPATVSSYSALFAVLTLLCAIPMF